MARRRWARSVRIEAGPMGAAYIQKPFTLGTLLAQVCAALD